MVRKMIHVETGAELTITEHFILRNFWEYYVLDENNNPDNPEVVTALVMGEEQEIGDVYLPEVKPYVISRTKRLEEVMPASGYRWADA